MTERAKKIRAGKIQRAIAAMKDSKRKDRDGLVYLREDEVKTILNMLRIMFNRCQALTLETTCELCSLRATCEEERSRV